MKLEELGSIPLFAGLSPSQLARPAELFEVIAFPAGTAIFTAGDRADRFYVVQSGVVIIRFHPYDGGSLDIATIERGGAFGVPKAQPSAVSAQRSSDMVDLGAARLLGQLPHRSQ